MWAILALLSAIVFAGTFAAVPMLGFAAGLAALYCGGKAESDSGEGIMPLLFFLAVLGGAAVALRGLWQWLFG